MRLVSQGVGVASVVIAGIKWLRVIQREHYLPGSVVKIYRTWARSSTSNIVLGALPFVMAAVSVSLFDADLSLLIGALALGLFPIGMPIRGRTGPLAWTPRLRRLGAITLLLTLGAAIFGGWLVSSLASGSAIAPIPNALSIAAFVLILELSLLVAAPWERRLSRRFVDQASATLARIRPVVVGITGSYGKTSTKGYVRDLTGGTRRVIASPASFNNRMGLARAVNEHLTGDAEVFVAEMGTYGQGEIEDMCAWVPPHIAVITAIGPVHLERFKTEANIVAAKSEILATAGVGVFNVDHPSLRDLADRADVETVWRCGTSEAATDVQVIPHQGGHQLTVRGRVVGTVGAKDLFAANLACAVAVALELGVTESQVLDRSAELAAPAHRQTVATSDAGFAIIDDTFNSNPAGAARALEVLSAHGGPQARRVVVTPGMVELGPRQAAENRRFAAAAAGVADDVVIVGRTNRRALREGTKAANSSVIVMATRDEAVEWVRTQLGPGDVVLYENDLPDHYP